MILEFIVNALIGGLVTVGAYRMGVWLIGWWQDRER